MVMAMIPSGDTEQYTTMCLISGKFIVGKFIVGKFLVGKFIVGKECIESKRVCSNKTLG